MRFAVILLSLSAAACAQDTKPAASRRLESITWDLKAERLVWVVQTGSTVDGKFAPAAEQRYEISPADAVMAYSDQKRGFTQQEAASLRHLLDVLSLYCAESVAWWDDGQGEPLDRSGKPIHPPQRQRPQDEDRDKVKSKGTRVAHPVERTPARRAPIDLVAQSR
jgi:hypothetical protein